MLNGPRLWRRGIENIFCARFGGGKYEFTQIRLLLSRLKILNARLSDSGNYSCVPTMGESSSVMVHVINGMMLLLALV